MYARPVVATTMFLGAVLLGAVPVKAGTATGPPSQPDLDVTHISITPRPFSYMPNYDLGYGRPTDPNKDPRSGGAAVISLEAAQAIPHYHQPGDTVTFTAHVVNHGGRATAPYNWAFEVDGVTIAEGREETGLVADATASVPGTYTLKGFQGAPVGYTFNTWSLKAGAWKDFSTQWVWQDGPHKVRFAVTPDASVPAEISVRNNAREDWTNAMSFFITVRKGVSGVLGEDPAPRGYNGFRCAQNFTDTGSGGYPAGAGSYSFEDWLQYHVDLMHDKFAKSIWPAAPEGILEHIRIDEIVIIDDSEWNEGPGVWRAVNGFDSSWPFGLYPGANAKTKDWGLIHEWGHQLGLIDIYNFDLIPSDNYIRDLDGYMTGLGRTAHQQGMMRGHGDTVFSEFDAIGMNSQLGRRRGWYGDYQYDIAATNRVRVLDNAGGPVAGATVSVYQSKPVAASPIAVGVTDADGYWTMPNRAATVHTTEYKPGNPNPYTENPNPFGQIDVVGNRGILFVRVVSGARREYFNLDMTDFVRQRQIQGKDLATFPLQTHFGPAAAPAPPTGLKVVIQTVSSVHLTWDPSPTPGVTGYRVYKGVEQEYLWTLLGPTAVTAYSNAFADQQMVRYAVSAVGPGGESDITREAAFYAYKYMHGLVECADGTVLVADSAREQPIWLRPDLSPIETFGSVHNHVSAWDVAVRPSGIVVYGGNPASYVDVPSAGVFVLSPDGTQRHSYSFRPNGSAVGEWRTPEGFSIGQDGYSILMTDSTNKRVEVLDASGTTTQRSFGTGVLNHPVKTIQLPDNTFLTTDFAANRIVRFGADGSDLGTFASLTGPTYIARRSDGALAVAQTAENRVALLAPDGTVTRLFAQAADGYLLRLPYGVAFTAAGDILVADSLNRRVVRLSTTVGGDVDDDGRVTLADVELALRAAAGLSKPGPSAVARGDLADAAGLTVADAVAIAARVE